MTENKETISKLKSTSHGMEDKRVQIVNTDIELIDKVLLSNEKIELENTHIQLDGKYQSCIRDWGMGMYGFVLKYGFSYNGMSIDSLKHNLKLMRSKLEAFKELWNVDDFYCSDNNGVNVVVNNNIDISLSFDHARNVIENMPGLTEYDTEQIISRINELERISGENITKKSKWEKIKPILLYVIDKGVDVAVPIIQLILQKNLGL